MDKEKEGKGEKNQEEEGEEMTREMGVAGELEGIGTGIRMFCLW